MTASASAEASRPRPSRRRRRPRRRQPLPQPRGAELDQIDAKGVAELTYAVQVHALFEIAFDEAQLGFAARLARVHGPERKRPRAPVWKSTSASGASSSGEEPARPRD